MVINRLNHQYFGTANLQKLTSNTPLILPRTVLWFNLRWVDSIIMQLIMAMQRFNLKFIPCNIALNLLQTCIKLQLNILMMMKWTNSLDYYTQSMMTIFCMLTPICVRLEYWYLLTQKFIQSQLCCFLKMEDTMPKLKVKYDIFYAYTKTSKYEAG